MKRADRVALAKRFDRLLDVSVAWVISEIDRAVRKARKDERKQAARQLSKTIGYYQSLVRKAMEKKP